MRNPTIGIIADSCDLRQLVSSVVHAHGYQVGMNCDPATMTLDKWSANDVDVWLVELEDEDRWSELLDHLLEQTSVPIFFGDGHAPSSTQDENYPRWQRRIYTKLKDIIGLPVLQQTQEASVQALKQTEPAETRPTAPETLVPMGWSRMDRPAAWQVWVLGASLGGPEAVKDFLDALPQPMPFAFILAQHINPGFQSTLAQVLGRRNHMHLSVAEEGHCLLAGDVVVAPVEHEITVNSDGEIGFLDNEWPSPYAPSIDQMMLNVSAVYPGRSGAIIFSGMGNDGAIAAPTLQKRGCEIWTQSAASCASPFQPDAVRATGCSSFEGTPKALAQHLMEWINEQWPALNATIN